MPVPTNTQVENDAFNDAFDAIFDKQQLLAPVQDFPPSSFQFPTNRQLQNVPNPLISDNVPT